MGWNGSGGVAVDAAKGGLAEARRRRSKAWRGVAAGIAVVAVCGVATWMAFSGAKAHKSPGGGGSVGRIPEKRVAASTTPRAKADEKKRVRDMLEKVVSENVKEFVKKAATNKVQWLNKAMDPDDPDHALLNRVCAEVGTLLASEPGDVMIPWPYTFLDEDEARARGESVDGDGGNAEFLDSLKKYRIAVKDGDGEDRIAYKEKMIAAQVELLDGIAAGVSVNDSIRAAYEFRKQAYELRQTAIRTMREFLEDGDTVENTRAVLNAMNENLKKDGIRTISEEEVGIEGED